MWQEFQDSLNDWLDDIENTISEKDSLSEEEIKDIFDMNLVKETVLCYYHWDLFPVNERFLRLCMDAVEDEKFPIIFEAVSDRWRKQAEKEMNKEILKLESL